MVIPTLFIIWMYFKNNGPGAQELRAIEPSAFFSRLRVLMGDVVVCDLNSSARADVMKDYSKTSDEKRKDENMGFGNSYMNHDDRFLSVTVDATSTTPKLVDRVVNADNKKGISAQKSANIFYDLNLKCFKTCENWIPLSYCPITVEIYMVNDATLPVISTGGPAGRTFTATNSSTNWQIEKPFFQGLVYSLDDSLYAEYAKILETGSLPITSQTETMQEQTVSPTTEIFTTIVRNASKLNKLFVSFSKTTTVYSDAGVTPATLYKGFNEALLRNITLYIIL